MTDDDYIFHGGKKYNGEDIRKIPVQYLRWTIENRPNAFTFKQIEYLCTELNFPVDAVKMAATFGQPFRPTDPRTPTRTLADVLEEWHDHLRDVGSVDREAWLGMQEIYDDLIGRLRDAGLLSQYQGDFQNRRSIDLRG